MTFTKTITKNLLIAAALLIPSAAFGQFSTPMRDVENPDRSAFTATCSFTFSAGDTAGCTANLGPTLGKAAIAETINILCFSSDSANRFFTVNIVSSIPNGITSVLRPVLSDLASYSGYGVNQGVTQSGMRLVVQPFNASSYPTLNLNVTRTASAQNANCTINIYGHLVP